MRILRREASLGRRRFVAVLSFSFLYATCSLNIFAQQTEAAAQVRYKVIDLGVFMAREIDERPDLNQEAHVAWWQVIDQTHVTASIVGADGPKLMAATPAASNSFAYGINDNDQLVGILESRSDLRFTQAFLYEKGSLKILPSLGGRSAAARSISSDGIVVGNAQNPEQQNHAVTWINGQVHDLGTLPGGDLSRAFEIDGSGEIAGEANTKTNGKVRAVLWSNGHIRELGLLPGGSFSSAQAVNRKGQAVGFADDDDGGSKAVLFSNGQLIDLGSFGDEPSSALSINDAGQIVGASPIAEGKMRAFLWEKGHLYNLNELIPKTSGWLLLTAYRINQKGQILAYGFYQGHTHACLLTTP